MVVCMNMSGELLENGYFTSGYRASEALCALHNVVGPNFVQLLHGNLSWEEFKNVRGLTYPKDIVCHMTHQSVL